MHVLGELLQSAVTVPVVRLLYGLRSSSQTALLYVNPLAFKGGIS